MHKGNDVGWPILIPENRWCFRATVLLALSFLETGVVRTVTTDSAGFYAAPNLLPGNYEVIASAAGFSTVEQSGITLTVGAQQVLNISLKVGQVNQTVRVTGEAAAVQLASSSIGGTVNETTIRELPLNGRDWTQLASLQPGVNTVPTQDAIGANANRGNRGFGNQITVSGTRPQTNNYRLDGISIVDYSGGAPGSVIGVSLGVDAIAEFSVLTSNYSAEYGRTSGGVVNAITRSGTNQFHGSAYEFLRNSALDARNFFDGPKIPAFKRNQFGGTVGGPIRKDKLFFFFDYEGIRQSLGTTNSDIVPTPTAETGLLNFSSPAAFPTSPVPCVGNGVSGTFNGNPYSQCVVPVNPLVKPYFAFLPAPTSAVGGSKDLGNTGIVHVPVQTKATENYETARLDYKILASDSLAGSWFHDTSVYNSPDKFAQWVAGNTGSRDMFGLEETHVFSSTLVNSARFGFSRVIADSNQGLSVINPLAKDTSLGTFAGRAAAGITVSGLTAFVGGYNSLSAPSHTWNSFQGYDDAFLTRGAHSIKFGAVVERMQHNFSVSGNEDGIFSFSSLQNFLTDNPSTFKGQVPSSFTEFGVRQTLFGGYLQDDWRIRPNLTLNLGVRYEMVTVPNEVDNRLANLRTIANPTPFLGPPYFHNPTYRNFEPRVGFAWDPFHDGKTAVRGAFGMFDILPLNLEFFNAQNSSAPYVESISGANLPANKNLFPTAILNVVTVNPSTLADPYIEFTPKRNYVMIWNLNVERQLTANTTLTVGYVGNHGVHMLNRADDVNVVLPTVTPQGLLWPTPRGSGTRINPGVGQERGMYWSGSAYYDALQVQLEKKFSRGFQAQGAYTWGKGIDTGSASVVGDPFVNSISSLYWFCPSCRRGLSDFNIAQTLVINGVWDVPGPKNWGAVASHVLGGWQLGGIFTAESGVPFTPKMSGDPLGLDNFDPYAFPNRVAGPGCHAGVNPGNPNDYIKLSCFAAPNPLTLLGDSGRNSLIGPGLMSLDFSLFKNNYIPKISETFNVQFRAEAFNSLNRANFAVPIDNSALFDQNGNPIAGAGKIDATSTTSRQLQFAIKVIF
jgi:hypothetical protein